ncbi:uncharacterized protein ColSpa_08691 [Colletotrichum spaethianum]|uniref:Clr5 domain-containing protein n=1 Tax=Colletotrichum spaethianum TaxID=700344 RepID=A0AA37UNH5_9PEZI|nr:uncharacterized protein ColSpa_08691 [Colletotrichum spaethianum]GKT48510.1 hypothetical protein ColSpa_08691 [Colletotrichum spaethianum]
MEIPANINEFDMTLVTKKTYATEDVWSSHRSMITRLYRDEGKSLRQIKQIMERDHSLYAT